MIFKSLLLRILQSQSTIISPIYMDNTNFFNNLINQTKNNDSFHHLQNTNFSRKSFLTGYDERYHFNKVEIEEPSIEDIVKNHLNLNYYKHYQILGIITLLTNIYMILLLVLISQMGDYMMIGTMFSRH